MVPKRNVLPAEPSAAKDRWLLFPIEKVVFSVQLGILLIWSYYIWSHFALTWDFSIYYQAAYLIAHGHFNPYSSALKFPFYQNDFELLLWPMGMLLKILPSSFTMLAVQDVAIVSANYIGFQWIKDVVRAEPGMNGGRARVLLSTALLLFLLVPWIYSASGFDWHVEPVVMPIAVYLAWQVWKGDVGHSILASCVLLLGGNVASTYLVGIGLSNLLLPGRRRRLAAALAMGLGVVAILLIEHVVPGGMRGGNVAGIYGYLLGSSRHSHATAFSIAIGLLEHPQPAFRVLGHNIFNLYGAVAPAGLIGYFSLPVIGMTTVVLLTAGLIPGHLWSSPLIFQTLPATPFVTVGTIIILTRWSRNKRLLYVASILLALNCIGWAAAWIPHLPHHWVRIGAKEAQLLSRLHHQLSPSTEVVASSSVIGRFSNRQWVYTFVNTETPSGGDSFIPIHASVVDFVVTPNTGIDSSKESAELARLKYLVNLPGAHLEVGSHGVYVISWRPPRNEKILRIPSETSQYPAWALGGRNSTTIESGPVRGWHLTSRGTAGYVEHGFYERLPVGEYTANISLSTTGPVSCEVWNTSANILLARKWIPSSHGVTTVSEPFRNRIQVPVHGYFGLSIFHITSLEPKYDQIEVRVWAPPKVKVSIYNVNMAPKSTNS